MWILNNRDARAAPGCWKVQMFFLSKSSMTTTLRVATPNLLLFHDTFITGTKAAALSGLMIHDINFAIALLRESTLALLGLDVFGIDFAHAGC